MDSQLWDLFDIAAGEPPRQVTVGAVRRALIRRRVTASVAAVLAVILVGGAGAAVSSAVTGPSATSGVAVKPPYYLQVGNTLAKSATLIRSTATGAITGRVHCPWQGSHFDDAAVAGPSTFFVSCGKLVRTGPTTQILDSKIYRFTLTSKGRITGYALVRGGTLSGEAFQFAASPDGSELALGVGGPSGYAFTIVVINTRTGSRTTWSQPSAKSARFSYTVRDLSFTGDGRKLVFLADVSCNSHLSGCKSPGEEVRELNPAGRATVLGRTTLLFEKAGVNTPKTSVIQAAQVSQDGSKVTLVLVTYQSKPLGIISVVQVSAFSGRILRVLYRAQRATSYAYFQFFSTDSSRHYLLFGYAFGSPLSSSPIRNGWLDQGKLVPLPHSGTEIDYELW